MIVVYGLGFSMTRGEKLRTTSPRQIVANVAGGFRRLPESVPMFRGVPTVWGGLGCWLAGSPAMFSLLHAPAPEFGRKPLFQVGVNQAVALQF